MVAPEIRSPYDAVLRLPAGQPAPFVDPWLEIDTAALAHNLGEVRRRTGDTPIMAVVKANAYGHGSVAIARELQERGVERFAVVKVAEAAALRRAGIQGQILNLGTFNEGEAKQILPLNIEQSLYNDEQLRFLKRAAAAAGVPARVHIKVDTGLSRVGIPHAETVAFLKRVAGEPDLHVAGIFTTLVEADDFDLVQMDRLQTVCENAAAAGLHFGQRHAASSAAVIKGHTDQLDMVRVGQALYGFEPQTHIANRPILSFHTRVVMVKTLEPGDTIAYHRRGQVSRPMRVATLPLGYADGYPFHTVGRDAEVLIRGRRWPLIVYMSANHVTVDVSGGDDIRVGDEVVLFGQQGEAAITISEVAGWADSSEYKICSQVNPLTPKLMRF